MEPFLSVCVRGSDGIMYACPREITTSDRSKLLPRTRPMTLCGWETKLSVPLLRITHTRVVSAGEFVLVERIIGRKGEPRASVSHVSEMLPPPGWPPISNILNDHEDRHFVGLNYSSLTIDIYRYIFLKEIRPTDSIDLYPIQSKRVHIEFTQITELVPTCESCGSWSVRFRSLDGTTKELSFSVIKEFVEQVANVRSKLGAHLRFVS